jgi:hypothetical protein
MADLVTTFPGSTQGLTTFEQQLHWNLALAYELFGTSKYKPTQETGFIPRVYAKQGADTDLVENIIYTVALPINSDWRSTANPLWTDTKVIESGVSIPGNYIIS